MNVSDLISRSELTAAIKRQYCTGCDNYNGSRCRACHADDMLSLVDDAVAAGPRWISVEERLPENKQIVIGYTPCDGYMFVGYYREEKNWKQWYIVTAMRSTKYMTKKVTHWMPLPEAPKEG